MNKLRPPLENQYARQGTVLLLVLVVVMLLSFSLYAFSEGMLVQYEATQSSLQHLQLRQLAESGIVVASDALANPTARETEDLSGNTQRFRNVTIATIDGAAAGFSLLPNIPASLKPAEFGLADESARLNINSLPLDQTKRKESRRRLLQLPQMTSQIADAILDWMDSDDIPSEYGTESSWYATQSPAYKPAQARFKSLHEMLLVRGVTREMLFGEDRNQNGMLDPGEDKNTDNILQAGLSSFLTVHAAESTWNANGTRKLNLNANNLADLYDQLETLFDADIARFVIAVRMSGLDDEGKLKKKLTEDEKREERLASANRRLAQQLASGSDEGGLAALAASRNQETGRRAGILLSATPPHRINSLVDLIGSSVRINIDNEDTLLKSPWDADASSVQSALRELSDKLTVTDDDRQPGRVNIFQASYNVLMTIPEMTESQARSIVRLQDNFAGSDHTSTSVAPQTIAVLIKQGIVDIHRLRQMAPYITSSGDVFRGIAFGHIEGIRSAAGIRFMIDATFPYPQLVSLQDLPPMPNPILNPDI